MADYTWDASALRFRGSTGRFVANEAVRGAVDAYSDAIAERMREATRKLNAGKVDVDTWQRTMCGHVKDAATASGLIGAGGKEQDSPEVRARIKQEVKFQYGFLRDRADAIRSGDQAKDDGLVAIAAQYAGTATKSYEKVRRGANQDAGYREERRRLSGGAKHCGPCVGHSARGWVAVDDSEPLPHIGEDCDCNSGCKCGFEYRLRKLLALPAFVMGDDGEFYDVKTGKKHEPKAKKEAKPEPVPKPAKPPRPAPKVKEPPAGGRGVGSLESLREVLERHPAVGPARNEAIGDWIDRHRTGTTTDVKLHGMSDSEAMHSIRLTGSLREGIKFDGLTWHFPADATPADHPLGKTLNYLSQTLNEKDFAEGLTKHTGGVYFTRQASNSTEYWNKKYGTVGDIAATGGDGHIVVYRGEGIDAGQLAHEMGHNLSKGTYGSTKPPPNSPFARAVASGEPPPTRYAGNSLDEDFAESVKSYSVGRKSDFQKIVPKRYEAIRDLLKGDTVAATAAEKSAAAPASTPGTRPGKKPFSPKPDSHFRAIDPEKADDRLAKPYAGWAESLDDREREALKGYATTDYAWMNRLRRGDPWDQVKANKLAFVPDGMTEAEARARIRSIDAALSRARVPEPMVAWRGIKDRKGLLGTVKFEDLAPGTLLTEDAITSTSLDKDLGTQFAAPRQIFPDNLLLRIHVPKDARAGYLNAADVAKYTDAKELTFAPGTRYRVVRRETAPDEAGGRLDVLVVEVEP